MAKQFLVPIDMNKLEILNARLQNLAAAPGSPAVAQFYYNTTTKTFEYHNGTSWVVLGTLDQITAPAADLNLNSKKITNLAPGVSGTDAVNLNQLNSLVTGLETTPPARAASTANVNIANPGTSTFDAVVLSVADLLLLRAQTAPAENGLYIFNGAGVALTRHPAMDSWAEVPGKLIIVEQGTTYADTVHLSTADLGGTLGTTGITITMLPLTALVAGAGMLASGNIFDIMAAAGSGIVVNADNIDIDPTNGLPINRGGTGGITAAAAKTNFGFMTRFSANIGDNAALTFNVDHNLNTLDVHVQVHRVSDGVQIECDVTRSTVNRVIVGFAVAPSTNQYRVVVMG